MNKALLELLIDDIIHEYSLLIEMIKHYQMKEEIVPHAHQWTITKQNKQNKGNQTREAPW